jgi:hypothetical protein
MWTLQVTSEWERQLKYFTKKQPRELEAALDNLDTFHKALANGARLQDARFGFIHAEPMGVLAVDQKGGGPNLAQIRLYLYPDEERRVLVLLTAGNKKSQKSDIAFCKNSVRQLRQSGEQSSGEEKDSQ